MSEWGFVLGALSVASFLSALAVVILFGKQARAFFFKNMPSDDYPSHLAAGIWLCAVATVVTQFISQLVFWGVVVSPMQNHMHFTMGALLIVMLTILSSTGYYLHVVAFKAIMSSPNPRFKYVWAAIVISGGVGGFALLWLLHEIVLGLFT